MVTTTKPPTNATAPTRDVRFFRPLFVVAAAWNLGGAIMGLLFLEPLSKLAWPRSDFVDDPISVQFTMMVFGLVGVLAIGYALVAIDPSRNRGLVLVAAIGKPMILALGVYFSWGLGSAWLLIPAAGITFFTATFWWFLLSTRESGWY